MEEVTSNAPTLQALSVNGVSLQRHGRHLLYDLSFTVESSTSLALIGRSGLGKTTLLNTIAGFDLPAAGTVDVCGHRMSVGSKRRREQLRLKAIGYVPQRPHMIEELSSADNLFLTSLLKGQDKETAQKTARHLISAVGIGETTALAADLSGGERTRLAIARALIGTPDLVLADEPTASLDIATRANVSDLLFRLPREHGSALVVVTHDHDIAAKADRVIDLADFSI